MHRINKRMNTQKVLGWMNPPETFTNREKVRPGIGRETGLGHVCDERTWMYSQRVSGGFIHPEASMQTPPKLKARKKPQLDTPCKPERLRAAHGPGQPLDRFPVAQASLSAGSQPHLLSPSPCALSRSTVHPVHKRVPGVVTHTRTFHIKSTTDYQE